ncbi:MAG: pentapeptide repeat-containing protein [Tolypothrix carrinoi HA7290-LM1]|nr:pentapeptide repeat-containing protein [Tolypothrix carrinoi HA7290-LM1]
MQAKNLRRTNLSNADLGGANLRYVNLSGVDLRRCILAG